MKRDKFRRQRGSKTPFLRWKDTSERGKRREREKESGREGQWSVIRAARRALDG